MEGRRPELLSAIQDAYACHGKWRSRVPIVYREEYNIRAFGLEKLHPFDGCKYGKIVAILVEKGLCRRKDLPSPVAATDDDLRTVHTESFLHRLHTDKSYLCEILELPFALLAPFYFLKKIILNPNRYHVGGTMLAMALAVERGWAINLGGGAHHSRFDHGEGWCFYADTTIGIRKIRRATEGRIQRILYIDCDVHQGNGVERDKLNARDEDLFILDVYNAAIWPGDIEAKAAIDIDVSLQTETGDSTYLSRFLDALNSAKSQCQPDLIVYNAGTDILEGDKLGLLRVTPDGVIKRDEAVFQLAQETKVPVVMLLSGGYTKHTHRVIADSILNLKERFSLF